jgi:segregation and condensation protein B
VNEAIGALQSDYNGEVGGPRRGFELREVGGGWRIYAREEFDDVVRSMLHDDSPQRLSQQALETLAVIAYKQPVTRSQVSAVRAVNVDTVMRTLVARGLITEHSTDSETGAIFYQTTPLLLEYLGIESLEQLPPISPLLDDGRSGFDDVEG